MLYQQILTGKTAYRVSTGNMSRGFNEHRHADIELHYCLKGSFDAVIDKTSYRVNEGDMILISPMQSHEFEDCANPDTLILTVIVGPTLLKEHFDKFSSERFPSPFCQFNDTVKTHRKLRNLLSECAELVDTPSETSELIIKGNLYKIMAYSLIAFGTTCNETSRTGDFKMVSKIEKALELIYYHYSEPITIDDAANATGYGKSNFCKIFKNTVGDTFHNVLNRQRVENACILLKETATPISEVAQQVGFGETKTFCRVFRAIMGLTPGGYRKGKTAQP